MQWGGDMAILVTGAAGFIGHAVAKALLARGERVVGIDNLNDYYAVSLKQSRLQDIWHTPGFQFIEMNIAARDAVQGLLRRHPDIDRIVHLAAQAGVRYSIEKPEAYIQSNLVGHFHVIEAARHHKIRHVVYASSSSVYGGNDVVPFSVEQKIQQPVSLYAATKAADELMSHAYAHLYRIPMTGLRFFTVYGPWGRPDMAPWLFTDAILRGRPIKVFNHGQSRRDFTYIDDIVAGVLSALDHPPPDEGQLATARVYNLGNNRPVALMDFIKSIESATGRAAEKIFMDAQPGDVEETWADIEASQQDLGFQPRVQLQEGMARFVEWFRHYHEI